MPSSSPASTLPSEQAPGSQGTTLNDLRAAQKLHDSRQSNTGKFETSIRGSRNEFNRLYLDDDVADLLLNGLPSGPLKPAGPGGFRLNYDTETPLRQIDLGGPDQQQRCAI